MLARRRASALRGFTLIEALITVAILAILMAMGLPGLQGWLLNSRIRTAAEEALSGLQLARGEAVRRNCNVEFVLGAGVGWTVQALGSCPGANGVPIVIETRSANVGVGGASGTTDITVTPTPAGATTVTFDGLGRRTANAAGAALTQVVYDLPATILAATDTRELQINIGLNGQIRMCDPNVVSTTDSRKC